MTRRVCHTQAHLDGWAEYLKTLGPQLPITVSWKEGADRSLEQNKLAWKWNGEISRWRGDLTPDEVHRHNKLHHGVPIRREDEEFRETYDRIIRPLGYEAKLEIMGPPIDLPVTRDMTVKQMTRYLNAVYNEWTTQGVKLTLPDWR